LGLISTGFARRSRALQQLVDALGEFLDTEAENLNVVAQSGDRLQLIAHGFELRGRKGIRSTVCRCRATRTGGPTTLA
jgi:hypothetical protein